jgi:hypothetical protein
VAICGAMAAPDAARAVCVLTCPENITITTTTNGIPVTYPAPSQTGCTGSVEQTSGLPSGSLFPPGTTTNSFRDTVSTGSTCAFDVSITFLPQRGAPAAGPLGLAVLAAGLAGFGAWAARRRRT